MFYVELDGVHQTHAPTLGAAVQECKGIAKKSNGKRLYFDVVPSGKELLREPYTPQRRYVFGGEGMQGLVGIKNNRDSDGNIRTILS